MSNKKTIVIVCITILLIFLIIFSVYFIKVKINDLEVGGAMDNIKIIDKKEDDLKELKIEYPDISNDQLNFYEKIANPDNSEIIFNSCTPRADSDKCITSVAIIKNDSRICHNLDSISEESEKKCLNYFVKKNSKEEVGECQSFFGDNFFNCIAEIFTIYENKSDCAGLLDVEIRDICEEIFNYKDIYLKYDRELCKNIKNEKLNEYCLKNIIDKFQDSDGDGLTDLDEINIYGTRHLSADTDGDGYNDGDEVKNGFNPKGPGKLVQ